MPGVRRKEVQDLLRKTARNDWCVPRRDTMYVSGEAGKVGVTQVNTSAAEVLDVKTQSSDRVFASWILV